MAYATQSDLEARLGSVDRLAVLLSDETGIEISGRLAAAIADAEAEIDAILAPRWPFPITGTIPATVTRWTADLALAALAEDRPTGGMGNLAKRAERARAEILQAASGRRTITGLAMRNPVGGVAEPDRTFTRGEDQADGSGGTMDHW